MNGYIPSIASSAKRSSYFARAEISPKTSPCKNIWKYTENAQKCAAYRKHFSTFAIINDRHRDDRKGKSFRISNSNWNISYGKWMVGAGVVGMCWLLSDENEANAKQDRSSDDETINTEDTRTLFKDKSTYELMFSLLVLRLAAMDILTDNAERMLSLAEKLHATPVAHWFLRHTFFKKFVAGENIEDTLKEVDHLYKTGLCSILDYSVESGNSFDLAANTIIKTIEISAKNPEKIPFACLKITGLTEHKLLEKVSSLIHYQSHHAPYALPFVDSSIQQRKKSFPYPDSKNPPPALTSEELSKYNELLERLDAICKNARDHNVKLLIDAEQTYFQAAIDYLALYMCKKYNTKSPIVYNTYQMYLKDSKDRLVEDLETAKKGKFFLGVKLVRGAYMQTEGQRAKDQGYPSPIQPDIDHTHHNYNYGMSMLMDNIDRIGVLIATHNEDSVKLGYMFMKQKSVPLNRIYFAQLYGMCDHLSYALSQKGITVCKYVPFGPIGEVTPYLIRRMQENRGLIARTVKERQLLKSEIKRRLWPFTPSK